MSVWVDFRRPVTSERGYALLNCLGEVDSLRLSREGHHAFATFRNRRLHDKLIELGKCFFDQFGWILIRARSPSPCRYAEQNSCMYGRHCLYTHRSPQAKSRVPRERSRSPRFNIANRKKSADPTPAEPPSVPAQSVSPDPSPSEAIPSPSPIEAEQIQNPASQNPTEPEQIQNPASQNPIDQFLGSLVPPPIVQPDPIVTEKKDQTKAYYIPGLDQLNVLFLQELQNQRTWIWALDQQVRDLQAQVKELHKT